MWRIRTWSLTAVASYNGKQIPFGNCEKTGSYIFLRGHTELPIYPLKMLFCEKMLFSIFEPELDEIVNSGTLTWTGSPRFHLHSTRKKPLLTPNALGLKGSRRENREWYLQLASSSKTLLRLFFIQNSTFVKQQFHY